MKTNNHLKKIKDAFSVGKEVAPKEEVIFESFYYLSFYGSYGGGIPAHQVGYKY